MRIASDMPNFVPGRDDVKNIFIRAFIVFWLLIPFGVAANAPPSWLPFEASSPNGLYVAEVFTLDASPNLNPWAKQYRIRMKEKAAERLLWESQYEFDGYQGGRPSNDGRYFVYINFWYYEDHPIVTVYQRGSTVRFSGGDLHISSAGLQTTASHKLWLAEGAHFYPEQGEPRCLLINTFQGIRVIELGDNPAYMPFWDMCSSH